MGGKHICCVDGCENRLQDGLSFFRCPKEQRRCQMWKNALGFTGSHKYSDFMPEQCHNCIRICALHFDEDSFANSSRSRIHNYAVPSLRLTIDSVEKGNEAKKSWEKLQNNHRDALRCQKHVKQKNGSGAINIKPWRFQKQMAFLIPYMSNRTSNPNIESNNEEILDNDEISQDQEDTKEIDIDESQICTRGTDRSNEQALTETEPTATRKRRIIDTSTNLLYQSVEDNQERVVIRQREHETTNDFTISNVKHDPLFHFFMSMYESTKLLPPFSQHNIKTGVFGIVSQEEAINLSQTQCSSPDLKNERASSEYDFL